MYFLDSFKKHFFPFRPVVLQQNNQMPKQLIITTFWEHPCLNAFQDENID